MLKDAVEDGSKPADGMMELFAVMCVSDEHHVSFIKDKDQAYQSWWCFDSKQEGLESALNYC